MKLLPVDLAALAAGGKPALARCLSALESTPEDAALVAVLEAAWARPRGIALGLTGPPGVGKSTLVSALVGELRRRGETVAVVAVDPSSRRSGGALLGDRARIEADPEDAGVFVRSMAARRRLGGLADLTFPAVVLMRACFDRVLVETVGVGQSETEVAEVADTVAVVVQPGSGDALQFIKAGIMEVPDVLVVTKADLGDIALRARRDLSAALRSLGERDKQVVAVSSVPPTTGIDDLVGALDAHRETLDLPARRAETRRTSALADFVVEHGERGLRALGGRRAALKFLGEQDGGLDVASLVDLLEEKALAK